jgi:hypothetical protein
MEAIAAMNIGTTDRCILIATCASRKRRSSNYTHAHTEIPARSLTR